MRRRVSLRSALALGSVFAVAGGCSTFGDEASPPPSGSDASADATPAVDTGTGADAPSPDAAPADGGATFCTSPAGKAFKFCRDFEDGESVTFGFAAVQGSPLLDSTTSTSPTHAMWTQSPGTFVRYETNDAPTNAQRIRTAVYLGTFTAPTGDPRATVFLRVVQAPGPTECVHELFALTNTTRLDTRAAADSGSVTAQIALPRIVDARRWTAVEIGLAQDPAGVRVTVRFDGEIVLADSLTKCPALAPTVHVFLGLVTAVTGGEARFDDFAFGGN